MDNRKLVETVCKRIGPRYVRCADFVCGALPPPVLPPRGEGWKRAPAAQALGAPIAVGVVWDRRENRLPREYQVPRQRKTRTVRGAERVARFRALDSRGVARWQEQTAAAFKAVVAP